MKPWIYADLDTIIDTYSEPPKEEKHGQWIEYGEPNEYGIYQLWYYKCSCCGAVGLADFNFCPNCGTKMVKE